MADPADDFLDELALPPEVALLAYKSWRAGMSIPHIAALVTLELSTNWTT